MLLFKEENMKFFLLKLAYIVLLASAGQGQCNESNWEEHYPDMQGCDLGGANLSGEDLSEANLFGADLSEANLQNTNFSGSNLSNAIFINVSSGYVNFTGANMKNANLQDASLPQSWFCKANLSEADLTNGGFIYTSFAYANVSGANLTEAVFYQGNLSGGDFSEADMTEASLSPQTIISFACFEGTINPPIAENHQGTPLFEGCAGELHNEGPVDLDNDGLVDEFPSISIIDGNAIVLIQGSLDQYTDSGASCSDQEDGDITQNVEVSGQIVNMNISGTYTVSYDCSDSDGNVAQTKDRTIFVIPPIIADENEDGFDDDAFLAGAQSGDINGDGSLNVADIVEYISIILSQ